MEDTSTETAQLSGNGWTMAYQKTGKNQSRAPISLARTAAMYGAASLAADTDTAREVTRRRGMRETTKRHTTDAGVEKTRISTDAAIERAKLEHLGQ